MFYFSYFKDSAIITVWGNSYYKNICVAHGRYSNLPFFFFFTFLLKKKKKVTVIYFLEERFEEEILHSVQTKIL